MNERNTLIVDDTPSTASDNPRNLISIKPFTHGADDALLHTQIELERRLALFDATGDVRE